MSGYGIPALPFDPAQRPLEAGVRERLDLPAAVADEVVMVIVALPRLVARRAGTELDPLHEPALGEQVEHAVHTGDSDLPTLRAQDVEDLLGAQAALLPAE